MANNNQEQRIRQLADSFINIANEHIETQDKAMTNTAFMYAASRFCAYVAASSARNLDDYQNKQSQGIEYFTGEFQRMLKSNMKSYEKVFDASETLPYEEFMKK